MNELRMVSRVDALAEIPDLPATLEFRAVALEADSTIWRCGQGLLLVDADKTMICAMGTVAVDDVVQACRSATPRCELLADEPAHDVLRGAVELEGAKIHALAAPWRLGVHSRADYAIRPLEPEESRAHLPDELRREVESALAETAVWTAIVDGVPASFAYSSSMTETLADISIDTLEAHRNRGVGGATAATLIDWVVENGRIPVWGAVDSNAASLRLAAKLGFTRAAGRLYVAEAPVKLLASPRHLAPGQ
jgi:GNAT superfamily N-acetyltransferase